jgi:GntR family transcriptional repressor for pyruvate dehydrogenase complex
MSMPPPRKDDMLAPLERKTLTEALVERLAGLISEGYWAPGTQIPHENDLAAHFNVGRTTVREALKVLNYMGYLEAESYKGYRVSEGSSEFLLRTLSWAISLGQRDYDELTQARLIIEPALAEQAATQISEEALGRLEACVARMAETLDDETQFLYADRDFHIILAEASNNRILFRVTVLLRDFLWQWLKIPSSTRPSLIEHRQILEAIRRRDAAGARRAMQEHIEHILERHTAVHTQPGE